MQVFTIAEDFNVFACMALYQAVLSNIPTLSFEEDLLIRVVGAISRDRRLWKTHYNSQPR